MNVREKLQGKCNVEHLTIDEKIEYWHTHETGNNLREFLGMTEKEYLSTEKEYLSFVLGIE